VHLTEAFRGLGYAPGSFPVSEKAAQELLSLPMFPHITAAQQVRVVEALTRAL
jgi:dTDP-4-amino-4,6-dideoxygalactose transaminase